MVSVSSLSTGSSRRMRAADDGHDRATSLVTPAYRRAAGNGDAAQAPGRARVKTRSDRLAITRPGIGRPGRSGVGDPVSVGRWRSAAGCRIRVVGVGFDYLGVDNVRGRRGPCRPGDDRRLFLDEFAFQRSLVVGIVVVIVV